MKKGTVIANLASRHEAATLCPYDSGTLTLIDTKWPVNSSARIGGRDCFSQADVH